MAGIGVLWLLSAAAMVALVLAVRRDGASQSAWRGRFDRELAALLDRGAAELVSDRLSSGPLLVPVRMGHRILGPFLLVDTGTTCLRLQLYNDKRKPEPPTGPGGGLARLRAISYTDGQGWRFVFDGPFGPQRYLGWLVETMGHRALT